MKLKLEYIYVAAIVISILQLIVFFTNLEYDVEGWGKNSLRNLSNYVSEVNFQIIPYDFCQKPGMLLIFVCSAPQNAEARQAVRETWGSNKVVLNENVELLFFLGNSLNASVQEAVLIESEKFNDIIQADFSDSYYNLTIKSTLMLQLVSNKCLDKYKFFFKIDDDMFVNLPKLVKVLKEQNSSENVLLGKMMCGTKPIKDPTSKWYCPTYMYNGTYFPNFLSGTGYVMSMDVTRKLYNSAMTIPFIHLEDVYFTGLCAQRSGITPNTLFEFSTGYVDDNSCDINHLITMHYVTPEKMRNVYQRIQQPEFLGKCSQYKSVFEPIAWIRSTLFIPPARWKRKRIC
ncbi:unnamed protein product [Phyllotreta striolata]|uniref:Hexosyltransferase n=1 Tax=Phyllotreta striolata TaxID=444603 RepID=A0A9N9TG22_PHYSR|nr:unnamed protein product [Phyllotreta striolata]